MHTQACSIGWTHSNIRVMIALLGYIYVFSVDVVKYGHLPASLPMYVNVYNCYGYVHLRMSMISLLLHKSKAKPKVSRLIMPYFHKVTIFNICTHVQMYIVPSKLSYDV